VPPRIQIINMAETLQRFLGRADSSEAIGGGDGEGGDGEGGTEGRVAPPPVAGGDPQAAEKTEAFLLDCATEVPPKIPAYAAVLAVLARQGGHVGAAFAERVWRAAATRLASHLTNGDHLGARAVLRLLSAGAAHRALTPTPVLAAVHGLIDVATLAAREAVAASRPGAVWQPYTDSLALVALLALPFFGASVVADGGAGRDAVSGILDAARGYAALRPAAVDARFQPLTAALDGGPCLDDSGSYSLLGEVLEALTDIHTAGRWGDVGCVRLYVDVLGDDGLGDGSNTLTLELGPCTPPVTPPLAPDAPDAARAGEVEPLAAALVTSYGPRGLFRILPKDVTQPEVMAAPADVDAGDGATPSPAALPPCSGAAALARVVLNDHVADILEVWHDDRNECVKRLATLPVLATGAPAYAPLLAEAVFAQLLRLPTPRHRPVAYLGVLADLCRLRTVPFSRAMSGCLRELFARMGLLDPALRERLAEYLAYHLSSFDFAWPWERWAHVATARPGDPQRRFVTETLGRVLRLSYWGKLQETVPAALDAARPPEPGLTLLRLDDTPTPAGETGAGSGRGARGLAARLQELLRDKAPAAPVVEILAAAAADPAFAGGGVAVLNLAVRLLLEAGGKSLTHTLVVLERYLPALMPLVEGLGGGDSADPASHGGPGEAAVLDAAAATWATHPQRFAMVVDRLTGLRLVSPPAIVAWCEGRPALADVDDVMGHSVCWEILHAALDRMGARARDCRDDVASTLLYLEAQERFRITSADELAAAERRLAGGGRASDKDEGMKGGKEDDERGERPALYQEAEGEAAASPRYPDEREDPAAAVADARGRLTAASRRAAEAAEAVTEAREAEAEASAAERACFIQTVTMLTARLGALPAAQLPPLPALLLPRAVADPEAARAGAAAPPLAEGDRRLLEAWHLLLRLRGVVRRDLALAATCMADLRSGCLSSGGGSPDIVRDAVLRQLI